MGSRKTSLSPYEALESGVVAALEEDFRLEAFPVPKDRRDGEDLALAAVGHEPVLLGEAAGDLGAVPALGVADVGDRDVVVLAPEERRGAVRLSAPEDVLRGGLPLPFRHDPVLDPHALAGPRVGIARDVARGENAGRARLEHLV